MLYEVIVQNIGLVYQGSSVIEAEREYNLYVGRSKRGVGRAAGEGVTLCKNGEIIREHDGSNYRD